MFLDKLPGLLNRGSFVIGRFERPRDVRGDAHHIRIEAVRRAFVDELCVGPPASIWLLLTHHPVGGARNHLWVHVIDLRHVVEFHQSICGENLVGRSVAEP